MLRNLAAALALILLSHTALGLGLGTLKQSSALNEPFNGYIEILGATASDVDTIAVRLADSEQFERAGVNRNAVLLQLRFKIVEGVSGIDRIQISSREPIREPFLNFLIELNWSKGRMVREYTVLLDPPLYDPVPRRVQAAPPAAKPAPMPAPEAPATMPEPSAETVVEAAPVLSEEPVVESEPLSTVSAASSFGPVELNDTLWSIASANLPNDSVSVQQMMLALLRANPEAFGSGNINILKRGAILRMPEGSELNEMSRADAIAEVRRQHQLWSGYRDVATETVAQEPLVPDTGSEMDTFADEEPMVSEEPMADEAHEADTVAEAETGESRLELVAPSADDEQMGAGAAVEGEADVTLAREELDAQVQENAELQARISEANEIIDLMSRQVDIRDDELAAMQARLAELGIEAPEDVVAAIETGDMEEDVADTEAMTDAVAEMDDAVDMVGDTDEIGEIDITIGEEVDTVDEVMPEDVMETMGDDETAIAMDEGGGAPDEGGSLLGGLIPGHILNMVPGGAMTVLGILGAVLLAILIGLFKLVRGQRESDDDDLGAIAAAADDEDMTSLTEGLDEDDEPITETREDDLDEASADDITEVAPEMQETSPDFQATLEASAEELLPEEPEEDADPLEEVNVYLAYERFDQAEELVLKVIGEHPDEHKFKLRLLEVFYSSNNQAAYEEAARGLHDAVGEDDPLWESTVAMWTEMSPERALFAEGAVAVEVDDEAAKEFVDITAVDDEAGGSTMTMAPGSDTLLESTQVSLGGAEEVVDDPGSLDFDLGAGDADQSDDDEILDLTATTDTLTAGDEMLDLTAGMDEFGINEEDALDFTADIDEPPGEQGDVLDIGATGDLTGAGDLLDLTTPEADGEHDLLDVTKTGGNLAGDQPEDILNVTSPNLMGGDEPAADDETVSSTDDSGAIDFDISDTVSPAFELEDASADADEDMIDLTSPPTDEADDDALDFDISGLEETTASEAAPEDETLDISGGLDFDSGADDALGDGLELEIPDEGLDVDRVETVEMDAVDDEGLGSTVPKETGTQEGDEIDFDLSLQSSELDDLSIGGDTAGEPEADDPESEIEFDLALQDTTEMNSLSIDDTLELPKADDADESLEDLAKSMEESMADLDLGDEDLDDVEGDLDLSLADTSGGLDIDFGEIESAETESVLDFDLDDLDLEGADPADTVAVDMSEVPDAAGGEKTLEGDAEQPSDADEVDTKLNLAKAYIELGDNEGARSILDEVARDGSEDQQSEAQRLIEQLG